jgi:hypothetical protein
MKVRGRRECRDCGARWSYYDTGSIACPDCGSIDSRGLDDERRLHTAAPVELDLSSVRAEVDERPRSTLAGDVKDVCRSFVARQGFVRGGDLQPLDGATVAARELLQAADVVARALDVSDAEQWYLLELLDGAEAGDRPAPEAVPESMRAARGLAVVDAVADYRREVTAWLDENPTPDVREPLARLRDHERRLRALEGDVEPATAGRLLATARDLGRYLREGDEGALASATDRLDRLE